jgi:hypothetical protein
VKILTLSFQIIDVENFSENFITPHVNFLLFFNSRSTKTPSKPNIDDGFSMHRQSRGGLLYNPIYMLCRVM